jgi:flagellar hook assembly protein FlgD
MKNVFLFVLFALCAGAALSGCATQLNNADSQMPNPYTATATQVIFNDLDAVCTIEIYTLAGEPIRTIEESNGDGQAAWDLKNGQGEAVISGTYEYTIKSSTKQMKGKVVIIR